MKFSPSFASFAVALIACAWTGSSAHAGIPGDPLSAPAGLAEGAKFRFLFITAGTIGATSSNIDDYNTFVNNQAGGATYNGSVISWKALGSTATVSARDNVGGFGTSVEIYLVNGTRIANHMSAGSGGLWSGSPLIQANVGIGSTTVSAIGVWTGSTSGGVANTAGSTSYSLGASFVAYGDPSRTNPAWLYAGRNPSGTGLTMSMYGVSEELTYSAIPAPGAIVMLGAAGLLGRRRRA